MPAGAKLRHSLREIARRPLCRYEATVCARGAGKFSVYVVAGILDAIGLAALLYAADLFGDGRTDHFTLTLLVVMLQGVLLLLTAMLGIGSTARAVVGERESNTLESLLITPMSRREIIWAKLLGRTRALRRFLFMSLPGHVASYVVLFMIIVSDSDLIDSGNLAMVACGLAGAGLAAWLMGAAQAHCLAALAIYVSTRSKSSLGATVLAYVLYPISVLCIGWIAVLLVLVLGPILMSDAIKNFDRYVTDGWRA